MLLFEVMIAFIIATLGLWALVDAGSTGLQMVRTAEHYEEALVRARSHLTLAVHGAPLVVKEHEGDDGSGYHWRVLVRQVAETTVPPLGMIGPNRPVRVPVTLYAITVWVSWVDKGTSPRSQHEVRLDSHHVQSVPP